MEFNFSLFRLGLLVALIAAFWYLGGFSIPEVQDGFGDSRRVTKAWLYCVVMFLAGAGCVSIVDHFVGTMDRTNIRLVYVIIGVVLMVGGYLWQRGLRTSAPKPVANQTLETTASPFQCLSIGLSAHQFRPLIAFCSHIAPLIL